MTVETIRSKSRRRSRNSSTRRTAVGVRIAAARRRRCNLRPRRDGRRLVVVAVVKAADKGTATMPSADNRKAWATSRISVGPA